MKLMTMCVVVAALLCSGLALAAVTPEQKCQAAKNLAAGKYKLYCTVPGHEQSGMKLDLSVR